ncbi:MAG: V-type ATP synthase subunit F [Candidatus Heteroscillospira sp.]|jgi:V/A-type H+-transporting ATPase subunit F
MHKIAVLGSRETVMGFKALGLEVFPAETGDEARQIFKTLTHTGGGYAIIYVEENLALELSHEIDKLKDLPTPAVILIPGRGGSLGLGKKALAAAVERAVGSAI